MSYYQIYLHELSRLLSVDSQVDQIHYPKNYEGPSEQRRVNCQFDTEYPELHGARLIGIEVGEALQHRNSLCARRLGAEVVLAVAAMRAYAASLLELPAAGEACVVGETPELHEVLADVRGSLPLTCSRLPAPTPTSRAA